MKGRRETKLARTIKSGRDVTKARESLGMNMTEFAVLLKVSRAAISRWESGDRPVIPFMAEYIRLKLADHKPLAVDALTA